LWQILKNDEYSKHLKQDASFALFFEKANDFVFYKDTKT